MEWTMPSGNPNGWTTRTFQQASGQQSDQHTYAAQYTGPIYARYLHIEATADCSYSVVVRQTA
jgi:hypothetical protein